MNSNIRVGKIIESYYDDKPNPIDKNFHGNISIIDINTNEKFKSSYTINDKIFIKNDIIEFELNEKNDIINIVLKDAGLDCKEIYPKPLEDIKNTNYKLTSLQLRKTHIIDDKGYSNDKISKGLTIEKMWNKENFVKENYHLLLQCTVSLLCSHLEQAEVTVNTDSFRFVIPFYEKINAIKKMHLVQKRFEILNEKFSIIKEEEYNFRFFKTDNDNVPSLLIFSDRKDNIIEIITTYNLECLQESRTVHNPMFQEKNIYKKPMYILDIHPNLLIYNQPLGKFFLDETNGLEIKEYFKNNEFEDLKKYIQNMTPKIQANNKHKAP